jgi:hypothetical protein
LADIISQSIATANPVPKEDLIITNNADEDIEDIDINSDKMREIFENDPVKF